VATVLGIYREALALLGEKRLASTTEDIASRYALDDAYTLAATYVLRAAPWRFALVTVALSTGGSAQPGYSISSAQPANWLRTHAIFVLSGPRQCPIDLREQGTHVSTNVTPTMRYVSSALIGAEASWPEQFAKCVSAYLAFLVAERVTGDPNRAESMFELYQRTFADAVKIEAVPEDPWLEHQRDGSFLASSKLVLIAGNWRFAVKRALLVAEGSPAPLPGFTTSYAKPADWVRTQALYVRSGLRECPTDAREHGARWSANVAPTLSYVSSTVGLDATLWPEDFYRAVASHLGLYWGDDGARKPKDDDERRGNQALWPQYLQSALSREADPDSAWLAPQFSGAFRNAAQFILEKAFWRFALKTVALADTAGTPSPGFSFNFNLPADHIKTQSLFAISATRECPLDARETDGQVSANLAAPVLRYLSNAAMTDATTWSELFTKTVGAYLGLEVQASGEATQSAEVFAQWQTYLAQAVAVEAIEQSPWLRAQYDGTFLEASRFVLESAFWRFAIKSLTLADTAVSTPAPGYSINFAKPADWLKTQAFVIRSNNDEFPVDFRESDGQWSSDYATPTIRYLSSDFLIATTWPAPFLKTVGAYLGIFVADDREDVQKAGLAATWRQTAAEAMAVEAMPVSPWLTHQVSGAFYEAAWFILEKGFWRFALKTAALTDAGGSPIAGYSANFTIPTDHVKTQALYVRVAAVEHPLDARESEGQWHANTTTLTVRYVSKDSLASPLTWSQLFYKTVAAYLGMELGSAGEARQTAGLPWQDYLASALRVEAVDQSAWLRHQLDGGFLQAARKVLSAGCWRFALKQAVLADSGVGSPAAGYSFNFAKPADWVRTQALYARSGVRECPIDIRETDDQWSGNLAAPILRYVSSDYLTPTTWPAPFLKAVGACLGLDVYEGAKARESSPEAPPWQEAVALALSLEAEMESPWLAAQIDGRFIRSARFILEQGFWKFALKDATLAAAGGTPFKGFTFAFAIPSTWLKTQAFYRLSGSREIPIDAREHDIRWSANYATPTVRYLSSDGLDSTLWTEGFTKTVAAHIGIDQGDGVVAGNGAAVPMWPKYLEGALKTEAIEVSPWLTYQFDGSFYRVSRDLLAKGFWRFAIKTVSITGSTTTPSVGYGYKFTKPADWVRTFIAGYQQGSGLGAQLIPVDFRDEGGFLHANHTPLTLRYVSTDGYGAETWSDGFQSAMLSKLHYEHASNTRGTTASALDAKDRTFKQDFNVTRKNDDISERPKVYSSGRLTAARRGYSGGINLEQGY
jgi:hypothetical protein